jgi:hypothetical protein
MIPLLGGLDQLATESIRSLKMLRTQEQSLVPMHRQITHRKSKFSFPAQPENALPAGDFLPSGGVVVRRIDP